MRFPTRLLGSNALFAVLVWAGYYVVITAITIGIAIFGTLTQSAWEQAGQLPRWYALFIGVALVREYLPLYIAHGQTRRQFAGQAAVTVALFAPLLSALLVAGYLLEKVLYGVAGWPQALDHAHLFTDVTQVPLVFTEYLVEFLAWMVAGGLIGAGFYRWDIGGLLTIPVGVGLVVVAEAAAAAELRLPFIRSLDLGISLPRSPAVALGAGAAVFLVGLALIWSAIRDVPLRNSPS